LKSYLFDVLFSFTFFSMLGWVMETCYRSLRDGRFVNPGLLKGPYLILYGGAALALMASVSIIHGYNIFVKILCYFVITTGFELVSGFNARHFFNIRLWDYSDQRFQLYGHICLKFSIYWILLAFAFEYLLLPAYLGLTSGLSPFFKGIFGAIGVMLMAVDFFVLIREKQPSLNKESKRRRAHGMEKEFMKIAAPLLKNPMVAGLSQYPHHRGKSRLDHVKEVAALSFYWGRRFALDGRAIVRGALLHDLFFYDWLHEGPRLHGFRHHRIALENAKQVTRLSEKEADIIKKHMWPLTLIPPRYPESLVVCLADTLCSVKDYVRNRG
jgi:uncharacterized protein